MTGSIDRVGPQRANCAGLCQRHAVGTAQQPVRQARWRIGARILRVRHRHAHRAAGQSGQQRRDAGLARQLHERRHRQRRLLDERLRQPRAAGLFGEQDEVRIAQTHTPVLRRRPHAKQPQLRQAPPALLAALIAGFEHRTQHRGSTDLGRQFPKGGGHHLLLFGKGEIHAATRAAARAGARR
jgi:hypothetical protein